MQNKISDDLIAISTMMMIAHDRSEIVKLAGDLNATILKAMEIEKNNRITDLTNQEYSSSALLKFTEKEILKMPKEFKKTFKANGCVAHVRKRTNRNYKCSYEIRYAKKPYDKHPISVSGQTLEIAKVRFIEKLKNYIPQDDNTPTIPKDFHGFAMYWFDNFHKRKVKEITYKINLKIYDKHIKPKFDKISITKINAVMLQSLLDGLSNIPKKADDVHSLLNQILNCAVKHGLIKLNPLGMCFHKQHTRINGVALTKNEEATLLKAFDGTEYQLYFAVLLYTGLRPNEYPTAIIEGNFIKAVNSKRHNSNGKIEYKYIPITPMLRSHLNNITAIVIPKFTKLEKRYKKVLPNHKLYDMRTTFQTRCTECGISDSVIGVWMGNSIGKLKDAYTDFSEEYLLKEAKKFKY